MTRFLQSEDNPAGFKLEDVLIAIRADILKRSLKIAADDRPEALHVMSNNARILGCITEAIALALDSTRVLDRSLGPSRAGQGGPPRIGSP